MTYNKRTTMDMIYTACGGCGTRIGFCNGCGKRFEDEGNGGVVYCDSEDNVPNKSAMHLCEDCISKR